MKIIRIKRRHYFSTVLVLVFFLFNVGPLWSKSSKKIDTDLIELPEASGEGGASMATPRMVSTDDVNRHAVGVGIGQTFLAGDFEKNGENSITLDALYTYTASYSFDLLTNFHYSKHKAKNQKTIIQGVVIGIKGKFYQFDSFSPYCLGGFGFYRPKVTRLIADQYVESEGKTTFGAHLGLGADLKLNNHMIIGLLGHYHNPFDVKQNIGSEVEGSYFKLLITLMYAI